MPEPNGQQTTCKSEPQICKITIMFPVDTDEQAIEQKKKITAVISDIPAVNVQFSLMNIPANGPQVR